MVNANTRSVVGGADKLDAGGFKCAS